MIKLIRKISVLVTAVLVLTVLSINIASAKPVNWGDIKTHHLGRGYGVGISTCDVHSPAQGQGVIFKHRSTAETLYGKLIKYGVSHPGTYKQLFLFRGPTRYTSINFACLGVGSGIHT